MSALGVTAEHAPLTRLLGRQVAPPSRRSRRATSTGRCSSRASCSASGGGAFAEFERLIAAARSRPVIGDGRYRHQPVWVGDVAAAFARALERPGDDPASVYPLGGPQVFTFDELLDEIARVTGPARPPQAARAGGLRAASRRKLLLRRLPPPLRVTPDQITMLLAGTECDLDADARGARDRAGVDRRGLHARRLSATRSPAR